MLVSPRIAVIRLPEAEKRHNVVCLAPDFLVKLFLKKL